MTKKMIYKSVQLVTLEELRIAEKVLEALCFQIESAVANPAQGYEGVELGPTYYILAEACNQVYNEVKRGEPLTIDLEREIEE